MEVVWSEVALDGLERARRYIAQDNPIAAERIHQRILRAAERIAQFKNIGRAGRVADTRELVLAGTAYIVVYTVKPDRIVIIAVQHGAQKWPERF